MTTPEFGRLIDVRQAEGKALTLVPNASETAALALRFGLVRIDALQAELVLHRKGQAVEAEGRLIAAIVQTCAISGEDLAVKIDEPLAFRFVPARTEHAPDEEVEIDAEACDEIDYEGTMIDVGEAVSQSLALAIDPFAEGPGAEAARRRAGILGEGEAGPFAALAALKK